MYYDLTMGATKTDIKIHELNVESDVYALSRWSNISCQGYRGMTDVITKLVFTGGTYTLRGHIVLGLEDD